MYEHVFSGIVCVIIDIIRTVGERGKLEDFIRLKDLFFNIENILKGISLFCFRPRRGL